MQRRRHLALSASLLATATLGPLLLSGCAKRESAPDVAWTLLDGSKGQMSAQRGKVMLVNFWATSCTTCVHEMPQIMATHEKFKAQGFDTLAVAMSYDPPAYVDNFAKSRQLPFGVAIDNTGVIAKAFGDIRLTPTTFLVDKRGKVVKKFVGEPDFADLHKLIGELLAEA
ncbi:TlpA family protein disulfide reductase [Ideonella margarita]|uniref:TlpA disulfide reductase family protein n=1 Tax=Ideonella margarita TaxID=2984191 RepID=A0ABU9C5A6_9BURK